MEEKLISEIIKFFEKFLWANGFAVAKKAHWIIWLLKTLHEDSYDRTWTLIIHEVRKIRKLLSVPHKNLTQDNELRELISKMKSARAWARYRDCSRGH